MDGKDLEGWPAFEQELKQLPLTYGGRGEQDFLWKYNLPSCERLEVLRMLDAYNLNAFSLFGSDESLLETRCGLENTVRA
jgi:hypothetical protein